VAYVTETTLKHEAGPRELALRPAIKDEYVIAVFPVINYEIIGAAEALALPVQLVTYEPVLVLNAICGLLLSYEKPDFMTIPDQEDASLASRLGGARLMVVRAVRLPGWWRERRRPAG